MSGGRLTANGDYLKLTTYFGERDRTPGGLLADELLDIYGAERLHTSVLLRGTEGFGRLHHLRTDRLLSLSEDLPVVSVAVDRRERYRAVGDDPPQERPAPLAKAALVPSLAPRSRRRIGRAAGRAPVAHRTCSARRARGADPLPELHQRLAGAPGVGGRDDPLGEAAGEHAAGIDVERQHGLLAREAADRRGDVRADAGQLGEVLRPARGAHDPGGAVQIAGTARIAEPLPLREHLRQ